MYGSTRRVIRSSRSEKCSEIGGVYRAERLDLISRLNRYFPQLKARAVFLVLFASISLGRASANVHSCTDVRVDVAQDQRGSSATVCRAARQASLVLHECGLRVLDRIPVHVVPALSAECPAHALGYFDARAATVTIPTYAACVALAGPEGRFGMPITPALYESLIAHELTHAIISQHQGRAAMGRAVQEYLAYAIQLLGMPPGLRGRILVRYPQAGPVDFDELSELYLDLAPERFAVKSYLHFVALKDRCTFVEDLLEGRRTLRSGVR